MHVRRFAMMFNYFGDNTFGLAGFSDFPWRYWPNHSGRGSLSAMGSLANGPKLNRVKLAHDGVAVQESHPGHLTGLDTSSIA